MRASSLFVLALASSVGSLGCEVLAPAPEPEPPEPGFYLSTPVGGVRSLNDVIVFGPTVEGSFAYHGYAVGTDGTILRLDRDEDALVAWTPEDSGTLEDLESIDGFIDDEGNDVLLVVGANGTVLLKSGGAWAPLVSGTTAILFDVTLRNRQDAFIVGDAGTILRWNGQTLPGTLALQTAQTAQLVVGADGSQNFFPIPEPLKGVGAAGPMLAVGARGAVYRYDADGEPDGASNRWTREDSGTQRALAGIFTEAGVWVPTIDGVLMRRNGDDDWDDDNFRVPSPVFLQDVWVENDVVAVGLSEDIYRFTNGEWELTRVAEGAELRGVDGLTLPPTPAALEEDPEAPPTTEIYVVGGGGRVVRGPLVLPGNGEALLTSRLSDDDFID